MSIKSYTINVFPPFGCKDSEVLKCEGIDCPSCDKGQIKVFEDFLQIGEADTETCQRCHGTGKLRASVVIKWEADDAVIE